MAVFCSESIECFPGTVSKFFFKLIIIIIIINRQGSFLYQLTLQFLLPSKLILSKSILLFPFICELVQLHSVLFIAEPVQTVTFLNSVQTYVMMSQHITN